MKDGFMQFCFESGNRAFAQGDLVQAARLYGTTISLDSSNARGYNNLGSVYAEQNAYDSAIWLFRKAIAIDSNYSEPYYNLGTLLIDRGRTQEGMNLAQRAATLGNEQAQSYLEKKKRKQ